MAKKRKKNFSIKRVGEIMEEMDSPHGDFDLGESFQQNGAGGGGMKPSQPLLNAFRNAYEPVSSEHLAQEYFSMGRLREYFQAWIVPKMPDPLPAYLEELDYMGFPVRTSFDGTACIMVRYRGAVDVRVEEVVGEECIPETVSPEEASLEDLPVYTDDWDEDLSDLPPYEEE